jgi:putative toxin-antitoxin system antitoxin component (TIGR02293 family)
MPKDVVGSDGRAGNAADTEEAAYGRAGRLLGLSSPLHSEISLVDGLERELSVNIVQALRARIGLTDAEIYELIAPRRTLERRAALGQPLSSEEADRAVRIARVAALAQQVFADKTSYAQEWLRTPQPVLGDRAPLKTLTTESGARAVEEILVGLAHGFFA